MSGAEGALSLAGGAVSAYGQMQTSKTQSEIDKFNSEVALRNADIATQKQNWAGEEGDQNAAISQMRTAGKVGSTLANQGASGVEVGTGSNANVISSEREIGMLDAMTIRSNAARQAYGYQTESSSYKSQTALDKYAAQNAQIAGKINSISTLLGSAARSTQYDNFMSDNSTIPSDFGSGPAIPNGQILWNGGSNS